MPRLRFDTIRARLLLLISFAVLPAFGIVTYTWLESRRDELNRASRESATLLGVISAEQDRIVSRARQVLARWAETSEVKRGDPATCSAFLAKQIFQYPRFANFGAARADGTIFCSAVPIKGQVSAADRPWFQRAVQSGRFSTGEYQTGRITAKPVLVFGHPIVNESGRVTIVLFAAVDLQWLTDYATEMKLIPGVTFTAIDHEGYILARYPDAAKWVGKLGKETALFREVDARGGRGTAVTTGLTGVKRLFAFQPFGETASIGVAYVILGIPYDSIVSTTDAKFLRNSALILLLFGLSLAAAASGSHLFVTRQVNALMTAARNFRSGGLKERSRVFSSSGEVAELAQSFNEMAQSVESSLLQTMKAGEILRDNEERLRLAISGAGAGVWQWDIAKNQFSGSEKCTDIIGLPSGSRLSYQELIAMVHPAERDQVAQSLQDALANKTDCRAEFRVVRSGGEIVWVVTLGSGRYDEAGRPLRMEGIAIDVSERKRADEELLNAEKRFHAVIEKSNDGIALFDAKGMFLYQSPSAQSILGYSARDHLDKSFREFIHPDDLPIAAQLFAKISQAPGANETHQLRYAHKDGTWHWMEATLTNLLEEPAVQAIVSNYRDITERKRAELALQKAHDELEAKVQARTQELRLANEKLRDLDRFKSQFFAMMSHELRTPLNSVVGFTGIVLQGLSGPITAEQNKQLGLAYDSAKHLLELTNDILDLAKIEAGKIALSVNPFELSEIVVDATRSLAPAIERKGLTLTRDIPGDTPVIMSDRRRVLQILLNLLDNAVKFTERGAIGIVCKTFDDRVEVSVSDTGVGIEKGQMELLFEPYRQFDAEARSNYEGTGLGLYFCQRLVALLGGTIWAESDIGKGSKFSFTIPRRDALGARVELRHI